MSKSKPLAALASALAILAGATTVAHDSTAIARDVSGLVAALERRDAGDERAAFEALAKLVRLGIERDAAVRSLRRIPRPLWPLEPVRPLLGSIAAHLGSLPERERLGGSALDALQLGHDLAARLPAPEA